MDKKYTLYTVTKTHWDREWYMDFQKTRIKLVHLIDDLLDILDNDPDFVSFMMDGQTLPLYDYLEVKPDNRPRLEKYIREGRIVIGPWYILPDEILITGESHIRNYLFGSRIAKDFGAEKMQIGYLPDSFGHPSQMPQILKKLGMDTIMFWRGATTEIDKTEFYWQAPDGTKVLTVLMPDGYSTGAELPDDGAAVAKRLDSYIERFAPLSTTDKIYLSNGGDHLEPVPYLSRVLREANGLMKNGQVIHTTLPSFIDLLRADLPADLKTVKGELCGVSRSILLASTLSTRTYLKQRNHDISRLLENELEPLFSMQGIQGGEYPGDIFRVAWSYLLKNLPHDSICGCSVDAIHRDMLYRYNQVEEIGNHLGEIAQKFYRGIDTTGIQSDCALTVLNTSGAARSDLVKAVVNLDPRPSSVLDFNRVDRGTSHHLIDDAAQAAKPLPTAVRLYDGDREIPCVLESAELSNYMDLDFYRFPKQYNVNRCHIAFLASDIPAMGYKTLRVEPVYEEDARVKEEALHSVCLENEYFRVVPDLSNGTITVTDLATKKAYPGLNLLSDSGDCGDEYTYCPPEQDCMVHPLPSSIRARMLKHNPVCQTMEISGVLRLPRTVEEENQYRSVQTEDCPFSSEITLYPGIRRVDIRTTFDNKARYHRLRALFPAGVKAADSWSAGIFSVDKRPIEPPEDPNWQELFYTHPQKDFCEINNGENGLMVANRGLHEYEAYQDGDQSVLAVTLLRCVEEISKRYIKTRKDMGGWSEKAPDGQCIGEWSFEYSIIPHAGSWETSAAYETAHAYNQPMRAMQLAGGQAGPLPAACSMVEIERRELLLSCFKKCEFEDGYILRFYNTTTQPVHSGIHFSFPFARIETANLREEALCTLEAKDGTVQVDAGAFEIVTLKITLGEKE